METQSACVAAPMQAVVNHRPPTRRGVARRVRALMEKHARSETEANHEVLNVKSWWDACAIYDAATLKHREDWLKKAIESESRENTPGARAYVECRRVFLDVTHHFQAALGG